MGVMQRAMSRAEQHIWFNRAEVKDRMAVASRSALHISMAVASRSALHIGLYGRR